MVDEREGFLKALEADRFDLASHRAYADWLYEKGEDDLAHVHASWTREKQEAEDWLREFAAEGGVHCPDYPYDNDDGRPITYEEVIQAGHDYLNHGNHFVQLGDETLRDKTYGKTLVKYWKCWQLVTGITVDEDRRRVHRRPGWRPCGRGPRRRGWPRRWPWTWR